MAVRSIPIELDKHRALRFQGPDLADMEQNLGTGMLTLLNERPFFAVKMLLHYGLKWEDRKMTPTRAGELMQLWMDNGGSFEDLTQLVSDALKLSGYVGEKLQEEAKQGFVEGNEPPEAP